MTATAPRALVPDRRSAGRTPSAKGSLSNRNDFGSPDRVFRPLDREFGFTVDAAATANNALLPRFWTRKENGLRQSWQGHVVWNNPPYGRGLIFPWVQKAYDETAHPDSDCIAVQLLPAKIEQPWFHDLVLARQLERGRQALEVRPLRGRLRYKLLGRDLPTGARWPALILVWRSPRHAARAAGRPVPSMILTCSDISRHVRPIVAASSKTGHELQNPTLPPSISPRNVR